MIRITFFNTDYNRPSTQTAPSSLQRNYALNSHLFTMENPDNAIARARYTNPGQKPPIQILSQLFAEVFVPGGFVRGSFVWKVLSGLVFVRSPFCRNTSVATES